MEDGANTASRNLPADEPINERQGASPTRTENHDQHVSFSAQESRASTETPDPCLRTESRARPRLSDHLAAYTGLPAWLFENSVDPVGYVEFEACQGPSASHPGEWHG